MKRIIAIDPGLEKSGAIIWDIDNPTSEQKHSIFYSNGQLENEQVFKCIIEHCTDETLVAIEWISSMGNVVGQDVFETILWIGQFVHFCKTVKLDCRLIPRMTIKYHHTGSRTAKDSNIAAAVREKWGEKGTKKNPGFFYGVVSHAWQAAAVAAFVVEGAESDRELVFPFSDIIELGQERPQPQKSLLTGAGGPDPLQ